MSPLSSLKKQQVSPDLTPGGRWTIITNRPKGSSFGNHNSPSAGEAGDLSTPPPAQTVAVQHTLGTNRPLPVTESNTSNDLFQAQTHRSGQNQTNLSLQIQRNADSRRELIGHPDVMYEDYRKKRKRGFLTSDEEDTSSSESDLESLDSESDSTLYSESEADENPNSDYETDTEEAGYASNQYFSLRHNVVEFIYGLFLIWIASVRYIIPPDHRLKRTKRNRAKRTKIYIEETDPKDANAVFISSVDGYYHLACPFYRFNASRYQNCTVRHALKSIEDLTEHIVHHHAEPPLCKLCGKVFDSFKARNDHLRNETCEPKEKDCDTLLGVTQLHRVKILKRDNPRRTEDDRWTRIYKTIFEKADSEVSPYLTDGEGYKFSLLHDYWKAQGKECVRKYLADQGHGPEGTGGSTAFARLCSLVLEDLRRKVLQENKGRQEGEKE
ncbi:hypothetical protein V8F20_003293 [Naviculisporaceae sp. PSN 640]